MVGEKATIPIQASCSSLLVLVHARGRARTEAEFPTLLAEAGFKLMKTVPTLAQVGVIEGAPM